MVKFRVVGYWSGTLAPTTTTPCVTSRSSARAPSNPAACTERTASDIAAASRQATGCTSWCATRRALRPVSKPRTPTRGTYLTRSARTVQGDTSRNRHLASSPCQSSSFTRAQVAKELETSMAQANALIRRGELPAAKIGGRGYFCVGRGDLEAYIEPTYEETDRWIVSNRPRRSDLLGRNRAGLHARPRPSSLHRRVRAVRQWPTAPILIKVLSRARERLPPPLPARNSCARPPAGRPCWAACCWALLAGALALNLTASD